jgi:hypothetical protein
VIRRLREAFPDLVTLKPLGQASTCKD